VAGSILVPRIRSWYICQHINTLPGLTNMYRSAFQHVTEWIANNSLCSFSIKVHITQNETRAIRQAEVLLGQLIFDIYAMFHLGSV
jgi:hypothetical protein